MSRAAARPESEGNEMSRKIIWASLFAATLLLTGCSSHRNPLVGTWRLTEVNGKEAPYDMIKIVTPTRFAFGRPDGQGVWAGGGRVDVTRSVYTEIIEYHSKQRFVVCVPTSATRSRATTGSTRA